MSTDLAQRVLAKARRMEAGLTASRASHQDLEDSAGRPAAGGRAMASRGFAGESQAWERALAALATRLVRFARASLPICLAPKLDPEDLVQDVLMAALSKASVINRLPKSRLEAYLIRSLQNRIRDELRRHRRSSTYVLDDSRPRSTLEDPMNGLLESEQLRAFCEGLRSLPSSDQELILGRYWRGFSFAELARRTSRTSPEAARVALGRAVARLRGAVRAASNRRSADRSRCPPAGMQRPG